MINSSTQIEQKISEIDQILESMGITVYKKSVNAFEKEMAKANGRAFLKLNAERQRGIGFGNQNIYKAKNINAAVAKLVCRVFDYRRIRDLATYFHQDFSGAVQDKPIVELGCDCGFLLCLLAKQYPECHFLGIDPCSEGIAIAEKIARNLGLNNIKFINSTAQNWLRKQESESVSAIMSYFLWHELIDDNNFQESWNEVLLAYRDVFRIIIQGGQFITLDRVDVDMVEMHINNFKNIGFHLEENRNHTIMMRNKKFPLLAFDKQ